MIPNQVSRSRSEEIVDETSREMDRLSALTGNTDLALTVEERTSLRSQQDELLGVRAPIQLSQDTAVLKAASAAGWMARVVLCVMLGLLSASVIVGAVNLIDQHRLRLEVQQDETGGRTVTFPTDRGTAPSQFAATTSAQLLNVLNVDETGAGELHVTGITTAVTRPLHVVYEEAATGEIHVTGTTVGMPGTTDVVFSSSPTLVAPTLTVTNGGTGVTPKDGLCYLRSDGSRDSLPGRIVDGVVVDGVGMGIGEQGRAVAYSDGRIRYELPCDGELERNLRSSWKGRDP